LLFPTDHQKWTLMFIAVSFRHHSSSSPHRPAPPTPASPTRSHRRELSQTSSLPLLCSDLRASMGMELGTGQRPKEQADRGGDWGTGMSSKRTGAAASSGLAMVAHLCHSAPATQPPAPSAPPLPLHPGCSTSSPNHPGEMTLRCPSKRWTSAAARGKRRGMCPKSQALHFWITERGQSKMGETFGATIGDGFWMNSGDF
jgi:hypothetical protein